MRFLIGMFSHESNCFCEHTTGEDDFKQWELSWGDEVVRNHQGKRTVLGGFIDELRDEGNQILGSVAAMTVPSGPVEQSFYKRIKRDLVDAVCEAGDLDGVLLSLHGAMSLEEGAEINDPEGDLVSSVREVLGPNTPIGVVLDLHSDTTDLLLRKSDLTLAYNEEPHRDAYDRGVEAACLIKRVRDGEIKPVAVRERVPMLLPAINMATDHGPMYDLHQLRAELEATTGVLDVSLHAGFYGADQPEVGFNVVCTTDNEPELAQKMARRVALAAWEKREQFIVPLTSIPEAVERALALDEPVGLVDEADDPAGGGSGDSVEILRGMLEGGVRSGGISTINDAAVVGMMVAVGEGANIDVLLGAKTDSLHGKSIELQGRVVKIHRGPISMDYWSGRSFEVGTLGVLDVQGILVVVTETKIITENIDVLGILGFDVTKMQAVSFKGLGLHIRQALEGKIKTFIPVDGVGVTHPDVRKLGPYKRLKRPVWPLDDMSLEMYPNW
jgi:microcystin degradation protein MlrC